jgi:hypothetical protein
MTHPLGFFGAGAVFRLPDRPTRRTFPVPFGTSGLSAKSFKKEKLLAQERKPPFGEYPTWDLLSHPHKSGQAAFVPGHGCGAAGDFHPTSTTPAHNLIYHPSLKNQSNFFFF